MGRVFILILALLGTARAADKVDCSTLAVDTNWFISYKTQATFPDPPKTVDLKLYNRTAPYQFNDCGVKVNLDNKGFSVQAKSLKDLIRVMGGSLGWSMTVIGAQSNSSKTTYPPAANLAIELPDGIMRDQVRIRGYFGVPTAYLPDDAVMAVQVDGGKLLPLLYDGSFRIVNVPPKLNTLTIYLRSSKPTLWQAIRIDTVKNSMTYYRKMPFPGK